MKLKTTLIFLPIKNNNAQNARNAPKIKHLFFY